jgi:tetratricopeptide (TPR) repeat protein
MASSVVRDGASACGVVLAAIVGVTGLDVVTTRERDSPAMARAALAPSGVPRTYDQALARIDDALRGAKARSRERYSEWLVHEAVARLYLSRAQLTGSFEDYAEAEKALLHAFKVADPAVGPHLTAALFNFSVHRLDAAAAMLDRIEQYAVPPTGADRAELVAMRGDLAFYRGDYAEARERYGESNALAPGTADFRLAIFHSKTGRRGQADDYIRSAAKRAPTPQARAFFELHRGILDLDSDRLDDALAHFRAADRYFPGFWLVEEHIAEVAALKRDFAAATPLYRQIVARTGHPEYMDSLADIASARGQQAAANHWRERAWRAWQTRRRLLPEATYGHAVEHCLAKGDGGCALDFAVRNHAARPYGDAKIKLADALALTGRRDEAERQIRLAARSGWDTRR